MNLKEAHKKGNNSTVPFNSCLKGIRPVSPEGKQPVCNAALRVSMAASLQRSSSVSPPHAQPPRSPPTSADGAKKAQPVIWELPVKQEADGRRSAEVIAHLHDIASLSEIAAAAAAQESSHSQWR